MTLTLNTRPLTPREPLTETQYGVVVADPYRWLEDQNSPCVRQWIEDQNAYTRSYLDALPEREQIRRRVEQLLAVEVISEPWKVGDRYFYLKRERQSQQPVLMMRKGEAGEEIPLIDPTGTDTTAATAVSIVSISRSGRLLAYSVRRGGEDCCAIEFFDVEKQERLPDHLPRGFCRGLTFAENDRGFYYSHEAAHISTPTFRAVLYHTLGTNSHEDKEVFFGGDDPKLQLLLVSSPSGRCLGYCKVFRTDPRRVDFLIQDVAAGTSPRIIVEQLEGLFSPILLTDDKVFALTDWMAPNSRFVKVDLNRPDREHWCDIVPESETRIQRVTVASESILVTSVKTLSTHIEAFDFEGKRLGAIRLPSQGTASLFPCRSESDTAFFRFSSFAHPPAIFSYRARADEQRLWAGSHLQIDSPSLDIEQIRYPSKDGTRIPMFLVSQKGRKDSGPLPTLLTGYGGFGNSMTPQFSAFATFLIEKGCLFSVANLRGGAEFGKAWHMAAMRQKRQTAIDDFIAAAEWLFANERAAPDRLAIGGGSNGGLLVGAALTQRPDLFCAVLCLGPLLDMLRFHLFDFAGDWIDEFGSPEKESDFHALLNYSPYHGVKDGTAYPAVLLVSGDADTRCNPMHARKMAARLQAATSSHRPVRLDHKHTWGHVPVQPLTQRIEALTDRLAFVCHELGVAV